MVKQARTGQVISALVALLIAALYAIPGTAVIGAMLLTAYLGGATAAQVRIGADLFPIVFPALLGVLLWSGLYLRDERVRALMAATGRVTC